MNIENNINEFGESSDEEDDDTTLNENGSVYTTDEEDIESLETNDEDTRLNIIRDLTSILANPRLFLANYFSDLRNEVDLSHEIYTAIKETPTSCKYIYIYTVVISIKRRCRRLTVTVAGPFY